jgi:glycosyltransferase involved in cell wall biosynthesis
VVVTFHGSDLQGIRDPRGRVTPLGYVLRFSSRWVATHADVVILVSQHLARYLPKDIAYHVIPAGIDLGLFRPIPMADARHLLGLPMDMRLVLFVGNPERTEKRFWLAKEAVASLDGMPGIRIVVANNVPLERMPLFMNACDALLLTSSSEGSPNAVKEALACNLPVVSTDVGDVRQRIGNLDGCRVCSDNRPESLAQALGQVLESHARIQGRQAVLDMDEGVLIRKVIGVYEKATGA